jgi:hypothetical protein
MTENTVDWLKDFANTEGEKLAQQNGINPDELKTANRMDNILDIVNRKKKISVEEKVRSYRELVGLDMMDKIEKEGGQEAKTASRISLSIRDKIAQDLNQTMNDTKQYVNEVVKNRNGAIATPAILEQLEHYMKLDKDWLRTNYEAIEKVIDDARTAFKPTDYSDHSVHDLARTDDQNKGEDKDQAPFATPAKSV